MSKWLHTVFALILFLLLSVSGYESNAPETPERADEVTLLMPDETLISMPMALSERGMLYILSNNNSLLASVFCLDFTQCKDSKSGLVPLLLRELMTCFSGLQSQEEVHYHPPLLLSSADFYLYYLHRILI